MGPYFNAIMDVVGESVFQPDKIAFVCGFYFCVALAVVLVREQSERNPHSETQCVPRASGDQPQKDSWYDRMRAELAKPIIEPAFEHPPHRGAPLARDRLEAINNSDQHVEDPDHPKMFVTPVRKAYRN